MKIVHLISGGDVGGAKTHVLSLMAGLNQKETVCLVCFMEGPFAREAREAGIPTTVISDGNLLRVRKRLLSMIRERGFEIIHCHGAKANLIGRLLQKKAGIPVISTVHSDYRLDYMGRPLAALTYGNINRMVLPCFDGWISVSQHMSGLLASRGFNPQHIYTLYNGVDFSRERSVISREAYFQKIGLQTEEDSVVYGIAARINPVKDMTTLVRAFSQALKVRPSLRLLIAGEGEQEEEIRALAKSLCPPGSVIFIGWEKDIDSFYHAIDINLLTSLSEGFPYALTEGARMECATIASMVGGVPYLIDHGKNGLLFQPGDVEALREHMLYFADHESERKAMGRALYEKTRTQFSLSVMVRKQRDIYASILRRKARQGERNGVLICGAYGKGNRGDNAILSAIVGQLEHIDPEMPITVLSRNPKETRVCASVPAVYTFRPLKSRRILKKSKLYVSGGGTLMQDATSTRSLLYYLFSMKQAKRAGCKVMLYGCGIGPIHRERNRRRTARVLNRCADVICVRDHYSLTFLKELGVTKPRIHLTADPALLIHAEDSNYLHRCGLDLKASYALFSLRPWEGYCEEDMVKAVQYVYRAHNLIPILYCMEPGRDLPVAKRLSAKLSCPHKILEAGENGEQILCLIHRMSLVVSMRLHALIFATGQGVPLVGLIYDPKVSGFLDDLGQKRYLPLGETGGDALLKLIDDALADKTAHGENVERLRKLAEENEVYAAGLLS